MKADLALINEKAAEVASAFSKKLEADADMSLVAYTAYFQTEQGNLRISISLDREAKQ